MGVLDDYLILQPENQITASFALNMLLALKSKWFQIKKNCWVISNLFFKSTFKILHAQHPPPRVFYFS